VATTTTMTRTRTTKTSKRACDRNPDIEHNLSNLLYSTIACTLADPDSINFNVQAAVEVIVMMFEPQVGPEPATK
jgi:hypothetical protein